MVRRHKTNVASVSNDRNDSFGILLVVVLVILVIMIVFVVRTTERLDKIERVAVVAIGDAADAKASGLAPRGQSAPFGAEPIPPALQGCVRIGEDGRQVANDPISKSQFDAGLFRCAGLCQNGGIGGTPGAGGCTLGQTSGGWRCECELCSNQY